MEKKSLTQMEFFEIPEDDIAKSDKELIEKHVMDTGGSHEESPDIPVRCAMRGWLAKMWLDVEADDTLRKDAGMMAACFSDGYRWEEELKNV